jgi:predicted dinucleotide-binding enzyme
MLKWSKLSTRYLQVILISRLFRNRDWIVFIAGDDEDALEIVYDLAKTAGFNPVMAGDLSVSGTLESMQLLLIQLVMQSKYKRMTGWKILNN